MASGAVNPKSSPKSIKFLFGGLAGPEISHKACASDLKVTGAGHSDQQHRSEAQNVSCSVRRDHGIREQMLFWCLRCSDTLTSLSPSSVLKLNLTGTCGSLGPGLRTSDLSQKRVHGGSRTYQAMGDIRHFRT
ncbi:mitochondrial 2-oxoglutarate/malate carrier protein [Tachysurus ichikawai]